MRSSTVTLALALILLVPAASAAHWSLYYQGVDSSAGETREDDGAVIMARGNPLDAVANKVVYPGATAGDGTLFLDARLGVTLHSLGGSNAPDIYPGFVVDPFLGTTDFVPPGTRSITAWFGYWRDLDNDRVIDDQHDAACAGGCAADEFKWRGLATSEAMSLTYFGVPGGGEYHEGITIGYTWLRREAGELENTSSVSRISMQDNTALDRDEQGWTGAFDETVHGGLITTKQYVVAANAPVSVGSQLGSDLSDPVVLLDVDRYEALSADVETMWLASSDAARAVAVPLIIAALDAEDAVVRSLPSAGSVTGDATRGAEEAIAPSLLKEPNDARDDFEGRATFGGVGDLAGSFNGYDAYTHAHHLYLDTLGFFQPFVGVWAPSPLGAPVTVSQGGTYADNIFTRFDPVGGTGAGERGTGVILAFEARFFLWRDLNADTYVGEICDASDPESFDAERNTCKGASGWGHTMSTDEIVSICENSQARGGTFTVAPVGGPWESAIFTQDRRHTTRALFGSEARVLTGTEPVTLRWDDACIYEFRANVLQSRDALIFPLGGSPVPLLVVSTVSIPGWKDPALGIDLPPERVVDYDVIPATL